MYKIGFIGAGNIATAILSGILGSKNFLSNEIIVSDTSSEKLESFHKRYNVHTTLDNNDIINNSDIVILAIKPQVLNNVISKLQINSNPLIISVVSGATLDLYSKILPESVRVIRVMTNTPAIAHAGTSVFSCGKNIKTEDIEITKKILGSIGSVSEVSEEMINAVAAVSSCGPAYFCLIIEAMGDAGVRLGLSRELSLKIATETALGTAKMLIETKTHPAVLKDQVTSPAGMTIEGLYELEKTSFRGSLITAITAAANKATEQEKNIKK